MLEIRDFFENRRGQRLFYCFHQADTLTSAAWLFCNPFLEEKTFTHPIYVQLARQLRRVGNSVLRFDYAGDGDSEGNVKFLSLQDWMDDIADAAEMLKSRFGITSFNLFGLRFGATLCCLAAKQLSAKRVVAWDPIIAGENYLQESLMINLTTQLSTYKKVIDDRKVLLARVENGGTVNVSGYELARGLIEPIRAIDLIATIKALGCPVHVVSSAKTESAPLSKDWQALRDLIPDTFSRCVTLPYWYEPKMFEPKLAMMMAAQPAAFAKNEGEK